MNIQTLLWVDTSATRSLGTVALLGHRVGLEVSVAGVRWTFGDTISATTNAPGLRYTNDHPCRTVLCPDYFGHVYRRTGHMTLTATVTWTGRYRVDGGAWQPIPGTVTGPATTLQLTVRQARGILVTPGS